MFFETDPTAFQTVHVYNPMSSSPAIKIVKQLSAFSPPRYLSHCTWSSELFFVHLISLMGEFSETLNTYWIYIFPFFEVAFKSSKHGRSKRKKNTKKWWICYGVQDVQDKLLHPYFKKELKRQTFVNFNCNCFYYIA